LNEERGGIERVVALFQTGKRPWNAFGSNDLYYEIVRGESQIVWTAYITCADVGLFELCVER
jgi:hypothetical protein